MAKTYLSNKTRAQHTYAFFKNRKDDPEWHDEFIRIRGIRRREKLIQTVIGLITIVVLFVGWHGYKAVTAGNNIVPSADKVATSSSKISKPEKDSVVDESSTESDNVTASDSSSVDKSSSESTSSGVSSSSSHNEDSSNQNAESTEVTRQLVGKHFIIVPTEYDGIDITKAMDDGKAPVSTFHDTHLEGIFVNSSEVKITYSMGVTNVVDRYRVKDSIISFGAYRVPYVLSNGAVNVPLWEEKMSNGHTMTMQMKFD